MKTRFNYITLKFFKNKPNLKKKSIVLRIYFFFLPFIHFSFTVDTQYYTSFRCTPRWPDAAQPTKTIPINPAAIRHRTASRAPLTVRPHPPWPCLCNRMGLCSLHLFHPPSPTPPVWQLSKCSLWVCFCSAC